MTTKLTNKSIVVILAVLTTVVFAMSSQQAFGRDDPNAKSPKVVAKEDANGHGRIRNSINDRVEELNKELGLTEQQKKEVRSIFENERKNFQDVII